MFSDEPLTNLDYKLREQDPKLFAGRGVAVVDATSEPQKALLLGSATAWMNSGHVAQFGLTVEIYRDPQTLVAGGGCLMVRITLSECSTAICLTPSGLQITP